MFPSKRSNDGLENKAPLQIISLFTTKTRENSGGPRGGRNLFGGTWKGGGVWKRIYPQAPNGTIEGPSSNIHASRNLLNRPLRGLRSGMRRPPRACPLEAGWRRGYYQSPHTGLIENPPARLFHHVPLNEPHPHETGAFVFPFIPCAKVVVSSDIHRHSAIGQIHNREEF